MQSKHLMRFMGVLCLGAIGLASVDCNGKPEPGAAGTAAPAIEVPDQIPPFVLIDQNGESFDSESLYGKLWLAQFVSAECAEACPQATLRLRRLWDDLTEKEAAEVVWVSFVVDGDSESSRRLAGDSRAEASPRRFLSGRPNQIRQLLRNGFGVDEGHSHDFVLVGRLGESLGHYDDVPRLKATIQQRAAAPAAQVVLFPEDILEAPWLEGRAIQQIATKAEFDVFNDFRFEDLAPESGITFVNRTTDDSGKAYKPVHYDHGNGITVADVDHDGVLDVFFTNQLGSNELWRGLGGGEFDNITGASPIRLANKISVSATFADTDNDGDPDLYVTTVNSGNHLFENDGSGNFVDITSKSGLAYAAHSSGATFFDYNRDGKLDLFLSNVGVYTTGEAGPGYVIGFDDAFAGHLKPDERDEPNLLFENRGDNRFADVSGKVGLLDTSWSGDATPIDVNEDGWQDLYILNMQGHDQYYENEGGKRFVRKSREVFPKTPWGSMSIKAFDYDNDGDMDLLVTDMHSDMSENIGPDREKLKSRMQWPESLLQSDGNSIFGNALFRNDGGGTFVEVSDELGAENYWPWGYSVGDLNADGYDDVFIASSMNFGFRYGVNSVLLNDRGSRFRDSEFILGVEPRRNRRTAKPWFYLDCPGEDFGNSYCEDNALIDPAVFWGAVGSRSAAIFDADQDGDLDILTSEFHDRPMLLISNLNQRKDVKYLKIVLEGSVSNRDGLGAVVRVTSGDKTYTKVHDGKSGYLSQSLIPLYFGLDEAPVVDRIEVTWPSGVIQVLDGPVQPNQRLELKEP